MTAHDETKDSITDSTLKSIRSMADTFKAAGFPDPYETWLAAYREGLGEAPEAPPPADFLEYPVEKMHGELYTYALAHPPHRPQLGFNFEGLASLIEKEFCTCGPEYTGRGLTSPDCQAHDIADYIRQLSPGQQNYFLLNGPD